MSLFKAHNLGSLVKHSAKGQNNGVPGHSNQGLARYTKLKLCTAPDCDEPMYGHGLCRKHYKELRKQREL